MKVLSLFDGIGSGRLVLDKLNIKVEQYYSYEIDSSAIKIATTNFPDIIPCGDVLTADFTQYSNIDLLLGGSPCQDLSIIRSNREGLKGNKSMLFWKYVEALNTVKPKFFLFENVASMKDKDKDIITEALGVKPIKINTELFLPQNRDRYYWTNIPIKSLPKPSKAIFKDIIQDEIPNKYFYKKDFTLEKDTTKNVIGYLKINTYEALKRLYSINSIIGCLTCVSGGYQEKKVFDSRYNKPRKITPLEYERLQGLPDNYTNVGLCDSKRYTACGNGWSIPVIEFILSRLKNI